ncbi:hypothetical protein BSKO_11907 [Bryopsis sp. KO-2023]|nr:hypothetical protein BSKO_11907 [Bryopsis sp. KO-2023]
MLVDLRRDLYVEICVVDEKLTGGKPVKVRIITNHLPCGPEVYVDLSVDSSVSELKRKLESATGVPVKYQKVMLAGIGELTMGDKRTNVAFTRCGTANSMYFATTGEK